MRFLVVLTGLAVATHDVRADDGALTFAQVLAVAVRQSPTLEHASVDVRVAEAALRQAQGVQDTHLGVLGSYQTSKDTPISVIGTNTYSLYGVQVSLSKLLPTGATIGVSAGTSEIHEVVAIDGTQTSGFSSSAAITLNQPLLRGLFNVSAPIDAARHQRDAAVLLQEARARDAIAELAGAYWQVALAWSELDVRKNSLALAQKQLDYTMGAIRADKVAKSEALAVQEAIAIRQQDVIAAEQQLYDRSLALRQLAGLEIGPDQLLVKTEPLPKLDPLALDINQVVAASLEHSAELASLVEAKRSAGASLESAENAARPRLDVSVSGGPQGTATNFGKSVSNATAFDGYSLTANLTFDAAIERRIERGGEQAARARLQSARIDERAGRARIATAATRATQRLKAAEANVTLGDKAIDLAQQNIEAEIHRFELGKSNNFEVLRRQDELLQARLRHAAAQVDVLVARAELDALTGAILSKYGVTLH